MIKKKIFFIILMFSCLYLLNLSLSAQNQETVNQIDVVKIDNYIINPVITKFISNAIAKANNNGATCLIIELDTPGGLLESTRTVVKEILNSKIPIVTYISPSGSRAGSAGVFITYASHIACMAPSTNIGAAHPIGIGVPSFEKKEKDKKGKSESEDILEEKVMSDILAWIESIAETRKRNVKWVRDAVLKSISATETEAEKQNIIDFIALDLNDLIKKIDGITVDTKYGLKTIDTQNTKINYVDLSNQERVLNAIAHPNIAYILMLLGIIGLIFEFSHPGIGFPGIAGLICMLLALYSFQLLPINYTGLLLIILGIILFIAEALTPAFFGLLALGGIVCFALGSLMLIKSPYPFLKISLNLIIPAVVSVAAIIIFLVANALKIYRKKVSTGKEGLIGQTATAITKIEKEGKVFLHGEIWNAENTTNEIIKKNQEVVVVKVEGLKLFIKPN